MRVCAWPTDTEARVLLVDQAGNADEHVSTPFLLSAHNYPSIDRIQSHLVGLTCCLVRDYDNEYEVAACTRRRASGEERSRGVYRDGRCIENNERSRTSGSSETCSLEECLKPASHTHTSIKNAQAKGPSHAPHDLRPPRRYAGHNDEIDFSAAGRCTSLLERRSFRSNSLALWDGCDNELNCRLNPKIYHCEIVMSSG